MCGEQHIAKSKRIPSDYIPYVKRMLNILHTKDRYNIK